MLLVVVSARLVQAYSHPFIMYVPPRRGVAGGIVKPDHHHITGVVAAVSRHGNAASAETAVSST